MENTFSPLIMWFRHDLRLADNPALCHAAETGRPVIPVFLYDPQAMDRDYGAAQKVFLHHALRSLQHDLKERYGLELIIRQGNSLEALETLIKDSETSGVYWNRLYEKWSIDRDNAIKTTLKDKGIDTESFQAHVMFEPWQIKNGSGDPYKVFTPFKKACLAVDHLIKTPLPRPKAIQPYGKPLSPGSVDDLNLLPEIRWDQNMIQYWDVSEQGALDRMKAFFETALAGYKEKRDTPSGETTSKLSPYLRWGMISPRTIWAETLAYAAAHHTPEKDKEHFLSEVMWREFSFHLLYHFPDLATEPLNPKFKAFPWRQEATLLHAWQNGKTGYPLIDAGMRELYETGWMHNRVRMIVGSLLVKHFLQDWHAGEAWFWDCLVDACPANNVAGWQWIAGCGADAAPYFRIFNPITQGEKFNAFAYVRQYVPELETMPDKFLFNPWEADQGVLDKTGVTLDKTYPRPLIDHQEGRERALAAFEQIKANPKDHSQ